MRPSTSWTTLRIQMHAPICHIGTTWHQPDQNRRILHLPLPSSFGLCCYEGCSCAGEDEEQIHQGQWNHAEKTAQLACCINKAKASSAWLSTTGRLVPWLHWNGTWHPLPRACPLQKVYYCLQLGAPVTQPSVRPVHQTRLSFLIVLWTYTRCSTRVNCAPNHNTLYTKPLGLIPVFANLRQIFKKIYKATWSAYKYTSTLNK